MPSLSYQRDLGILAADCIQGVLSEECKKQIESMGIADQLGLDLKQPISLWKIILPLLLIPLIGITVVYFGKFHPTSDHPKENEGKEAQSKEQQSFKTIKDEQEEKKKILKSTELKIKAPPSPEQANQKPLSDPEAHFEDKLKQHIEEEENNLKKWFGK